MEGAAGVYGAWSLMPAVAVLVLALITRRTAESLLGGSLLGFVIAYGTGFFEPFVEAMLEVMADPTIGWIILVVGLFGSMIALQVRSGGVLAFGEAVAARVRTRRGSLLATWALGLGIFLDDYLNALTVGTAMRKVTDRYRVSREMLAYVVDSTAAPICVLVPLSTWAIYVASLLEDNGVAEVGGGLAAYVGVIPYMVYAWVAALLVPLAAAGALPALGPMRRAEERAADGELAPPGSASLGMSFDDGNGPPERPRTINFVLPILVMVGVTWWLEIDALKGVLAALAVTAVMLLGQRLMSFDTLAETAFDGFRTMVYPLAIVTLSFLLRDINETLGLTRYVIDTVQPAMSADLLPAVAFVSLSAITFATGSFWGVYAVALPIVVPLADAMGVDMPLALGAVISAGAFGSHACFYGDATVLSASASGCDNIAHAVTQLPYALLAAGASTVVYVALGYTL